MSRRARVRAGDPDVFRELFDEHARSVYNHAFRLTGNWSTAEDVVSLTFLEAWRRAEEITSRIDDRERLAQVRTALAALRQPEREVLALCVWAGLGYAETAEALGVPVGTVRSRLSRARKKLNRLVSTGRLRPPGEIQEPHAGQGQVEGDREIAVRSAQENIR
jgi:DNA-directed RNA polymerase specialized sigma24 family protein